MFTGVVTPIRTDQLRHRVSGNQLVGKAQIRSFHALEHGHLQLDLRAVLAKRTPMITEGTEKI